MSLSKSFKQEKPTGNFDVILIGSGPGCLTAASLLSRVAGKRVLILEKHYTPGGFTHVFKRKGYEWDVGVHYLGEFHREKSMSARLMRYLCNDKLQWEELGEVYDKIIFGNEVFEFKKGKEVFKQTLKGYFPDEKSAIDKYIDLVYQVQLAARNFFMEKGLSGIPRKLASKTMRKDFLALSGKTTLDVLGSLTNNQKLIAVLTGQYGDYGLPPGRSSFAMHAMVAKHYLNGACFPVGGCERIFETIARPIVEAGSEIFTNAAVEEILLSKGKCMGVRMAGGYEVTAPAVISGIGIHNTFRHLIKETFPQQAGYMAQVDKLKASTSHIALYLGFEEPPEALGLERPNFWIYPEGGYDHDQNIKRYLEDPDSEFPMVYVSFPSAKDPDWLRRYPGKSTVDVITMAPHAWFWKWAGTRWMKRGEDYEAYKEKLSNRLLEKVFTYLPQLKGKVAHGELSTPLSTKNFCSYSQGEIYGIEHSPQRFESPILRPSTPIKNLYLTGQDIASCGIAGAMMSGVITASAMEKKNLLKGVI